MNKGIFYLANLVEQDWFNVRNELEVKATSSVGNLWGFNLIWCLLTVVPMLIILGMNTTIPFVIILIVITILGIFIKNKGSVFIKLIYSGVASIYSTLHILYLFYLVSFYSDDATIGVNAFLFYIVIIIIFVIITPFISYFLIKSEWENALNINNKESKGPNKILSRVILVICSVLILIVILNNIFSFGIQMNIFRGVILFLIFILLVTGFTSIIYGVVTYINDKKL